MTKNTKRFPFFLKLLTVIVIISLSYLVFELFNYSLSETENNDFFEEYRKTYAVYSINIPSEVTFAGAKVPVEYFDVRESLDRELHVNTFWHSQSFLLLKRANRYFHIIEPILKKNNIPDDFKYLAVAESGLANVVSPSGAKGFWQFLKKTGKEYHLEINSVVDERYNLEKATQAACDYLNESYKRYNDWALVAASYNMGRAGLNKQIIRQKASTYYDLLLNSETSRYVYRILALKIVFEDPQKYGFNYRKEDLYKPFEYDTLTIDTAINDMASFANIHKVNYKILKIFNPWLRDNYLSNSSRKKYVFKIPKGLNRGFNLDIEADSAFFKAIKNN